MNNKKFFTSLPTVMLVPIFSLLSVVSLFFGLFLMIGELDTTSAYYYVNDAKDVYYLQDYKEDDNYVWWNYNKDTKEWAQYDIYHDKGQ